MFKKTLLLGSVLALGFFATPDATAAQQTANPQVLQENSAEHDLMVEQVKMLERAIVPTSPEETVQLWAKAVKNRNGALQYALFTENAKQGSKASFTHFHWVTGASSPWVETFQIKHLSENSEDGNPRYQIDFDLYTSTGKAGKDQAVVTVAKMGEQWYVQAIAPASDQAIGIWNTPESINEQNVENSLTAMQTYESKIGYSVPLPADVMNKVKIEQATCSNEEGNPPCIHFFYQDSSGKQALLLTIIRLSGEQEKHDYYQSHPFLHKLGEGKSGSFFWIAPSEHPYAGNEDSLQGQEWSSLLEVLKERITRSSLYS